jgi:hypothetical protein
MESKLNTVEDCFNYLGEDPNKLPDVSQLDEADKNDVVNNFILKKVVKAINKEFNGGKIWEPNYYKVERKYELWPDVEASEEQPGGFGLSYYGYVGDLAYTGVGSRLSFVSREAAKHAFHTFTELYKQELLIIK